VTRCGRDHEVRTAVRVTDTIASSGAFLHHQRKRGGLPDILGEIFRRKITPRSLDVWLQRDVFGF
jgi:hypothetical protein